MRLHKQLTRTRKGLTFSQPKTDKSRRSVRLTTAAAVETLETHRGRQLDERSKTGDLWRDTALVFTTTRGIPVDVGNLTYKSFRSLLERAGLSKIRFHALRHTFATLMLSGNVNPKIVQEILGHARISETVDTYSHYLPDMQEEAIGKLGKLLT